jgi:hypothetical protein
MNMIDRSKREHCHVGLAVGFQLRTIPLAFSSLELPFTIGSFEHLNFGIAVRQVLVLGTCKSEVGTRAGTGLPADDDVAPAAKPREQRLGYTSDMH